MSNTMYPVRTRLLGAAGYALSSIVIMMVNKYVLTIWQFPSPNVLALSQFACTVFLVSTLKRMGVVSYPDFAMETSKEVFPLPILFLLNTITGLAGTKAISIPMFAVLRRLSMVFTMLFESILLGYTYTTGIKMTVVVMMTGSFIAAINDLAFDSYGYTVIFFNNVFTSSMGVVSKQKLNRGNQLPTHGDDNAKPDIKALGTWGLMFYNAVFSGPLLLAFLVTFQPHQIQSAIDYPHWGDFGFLSLFILSSVMGAVLQLSIFYCTKVNSALTTVVTGCLKNVLTTVFGMIAPGMDYVYSVSNFTGVMISLAGAITYAIIQMRQKSDK